MNVTLGGVVYKFDVIRRGKLQGMPVLRWHGWVAWWWDGSSWVDRDYGIERRVAR